MQQHVPLIANVLIAALLIFVVYRRFRRTFGRQVFSPTRMYVRIGILLVLSAFIIAAVRHSPAALGLLGLGVLMGVVLALIGASRTRFELDQGVRYYIPHTYTGLLVSALFLGRLTYNLLNNYSLARAGTPPPSGLAVYANNPMTTGFFFVLVGYYVCYYSLVLRRANSAGFGASGLAGTPLNGDTSKPA
jgi:hypothetical protein